MITLRRVILSLCGALLVVWPHSPARAEQAFERFLPLLVDLDGWEGKKPDGMSMQMSKVSMTTATRDYQRGSAQVHASVMIGQAAAGALAPLQKGINLQTSDGHAVTATMHGMPVLKNEITSQKSGTLMVELGKDALFSLSYSGITEVEALALAEKFDWKAIQAATEAK